MKPSVLTVSSLIFALAFFFILSSNPNLFDNMDNDRCTINFFISGVIAVLIYHVVLSIMINN